MQVGAKAICYRNPHTVSQNAKKNPKGSVQWQWLTLTWSISVLSCALGSSTAILTTSRPNHMCIMHRANILFEPSRTTASQSNLKKLLGHSEKYIWISSSYMPYFTTISSGFLISVQYLLLRMWFCLKIE